MVVFPIRIKHSFDVAVQRPHDADAREHRRSARRRDKDQGFHGRLPLCGHRVRPSEVWLSTVAEFENDKREPWSDNLIAIRRALEDAGVELIPAKSGKGVGARLRDEK
jgi:hypothetical protein